MAVNTPFDLVLQREPASVIIFPFFFFFTAMVTRHKEFPEPPSTVLGKTRLIKSFAGD